MESVFLKLMEQLNSSVFILMLLLMAAFLVVYKVGGLTATFSGFKEKNINVDVAIATIKDDLSEIKATTKLLYDANLKTIKAHSPVSLTKKGQLVSSQLQLKQKVSNNWAAISTLIADSNPKNPYDVQNTGMDLAKFIFDTIFSEADQNEIKSYAYEKGENLLQITPIIGILARDRYLKENDVQF